jgi:hypothetical protein
VGNWALPKNPIHSPFSGIDLRYSWEKKQRQGWIDALKAGKNPFTQEEIEKLKG